MLGQPLPSPNDRYYTQPEKQCNTFLTKTNIFLIKSNKCENNRFTIAYGKILIFNFY